MTLPELAALLAGISGFSGKIAYHAFPVDAAPALPFIVYQETDVENMAADNHVFYSQSNIDIELYTALKDPTTEQLLEAALNDADLFWTKSEDYIDSEQCYMITYQILI